MNQAHPGSETYIVVVADDFGRASSVNQAVAGGYGWSIVTAASIMAGGEAFQEALNLVPRWPELSLGLHVTLCDGRSVLPHRYIPDLVDPAGHFEPSPFRAGVRYWRSRRTISAQLEAEVEAQFERLEKAGFHPTHVDCHHHLHMHPVLFDIIARKTAERGIRWIRIPREPLSLIMNLHFPLLEPKGFLIWLAFGALTDRNLLVAHRYGLRSANYVYGLAGTGRIDEKYLLYLLPRLSPGTNELYVHPDMSTNAGREEMRALTSTRVRDLLVRRGIRTVNFEELAASPLTVKQMGGRL